MPTCKDCFCYEPCKAMTYAWRKIEGTHYPLIAEKCEFFKERSKFIELPCKVGDVVYFIKKGKIIKDSVRDINYFSSWKGFEFNTMVDKWYEEDIGHKIYFTREEVEQALKERE